MHCGAEVTESSTNKQHHLSRPSGDPIYGIDTRFNSRSSTPVSQNRIRFDVTRNKWYPSSKHVCSTSLLTSRPLALRPCARQPRGCHYKWNEHLYLSVPTPSAESAQPHRSLPPADTSVLYLSALGCLQPYTPGRILGLGATHRHSWAGHVCLYETAWFPGLAVCHSVGQNLLVGNHCTICNQYPRGMSIPPANVGLFPTMHCNHSVHKHHTHTHTVFVCSIQVSW